MLVIYTCFSAAPWAPNSNAPLFLAQTFENAPFETTAYDALSTPFSATFADVFTVNMFVDFFEQVLLPTLQAAAEQGWQAPGSSNVLYLSGGYVRQLRVAPQTTAPFTCGCVDPASFLPVAGTDDACYPPFVTACMDTSDISLGSGGDTVPFLDEQASGLVATQGFLDR